MGKQREGPVAARKAQNKAHAELAVPYFVNLVNVKLLGGPYGKGDKFRDGHDLGPNELDPEDYFVQAARALAEAKSQGAVGAYWRKNRVRDRWVYAISVEKGKSPQLHFEMYFDPKGHVRFLGRDDFERFRAAGDGVETESDRDYLARTGWLGGNRTFAHALPLAKHDKKVKWHFFGMPVRLAKRFVDELIATPSLYVLDPGLSDFTRTKPTPDALDGAQRIRLNL